MVRIEPRALHMEHIVPLSYILSPCLTDSSLLNYMSFLFCSVSLFASSDKDFHLRRVVVGCLGFLKLCCHPSSLLPSLLSISSCVLRALRCGDLKTAWGSLFHYSRVGARLKVHVNLPVGFSVSSPGRRPG